MNQISPFETMEPGPDMEPNSMTMPPADYKIMRQGQRPLVFQGSELCMAMSFVPGAPYWFEINIYRTTDGRFVTAVRTFFQSEAENDRAKAWEMETFDGVLDVLESYDASHDIRVHGFADDDDMSAVELAAHGYSLMAKAKAARAQFSGLLGEILHELDA